MSKLMQVLIYSGDADGAVNLDGDDEMQWFAAKDPTRRWEAELSHIAIICADPTAAIEIRTQARKVRDKKSDWEEEEVSPWYAAKHIIYCRNVLSVLEIYDEEEEEMK